MTKKKKKTVSRKRKRMVRENLFMKEVASFRRTLDDMFDNVVSKAQALPKISSFWNTGVWRPEVDTSETKKEVIVKAKLPGCDKKDINLEIVGNVLTISGKKKKNKKISGKKGQKSGPFYRKATLPDYVDTHNAKATCKNGILRVIFSKVEPEESGRKISVK